MLQSTRLGWARVFVQIQFLFCATGLLQGADPAPPGQMVDLGGRRLHLNCTGSNSPAVIVENGGGGFSVEWALVQPEVAKQTGSALTIAPDMPGATAGP